jgi:hypothetical protein
MQKRSLTAYATAACASSKKRALDLSFANCYWLLIS